MQQTNIFKAQHDEDNILANTKRYYSFLENNAFIYSSRRSFRKQPGHGNPLTAIKE